MSKIQIGPVAIIRREFRLAKAWPVPSDAQNVVAIAIPFRALET